jgi:hypothetical protein
MRVFRMAALTAVVFAQFVRPAGAQEQTLIVAEPLKACAAPAHSPLEFDKTDAAALIQSALGTAPALDTYYMLHAVKYIDGQMRVESQDWFVYHAPWTETAGAKGLWATIRDPRVRKHFNESRIYGSPKVAMVYLHSNLPTVNVDVAVQAMLKVFLEDARQERTKDAAAFERATNDLRSRLPVATGNRAKAKAVAPFVEGGKPVPDTTYPEAVREAAYLRAEDYVGAILRGDDERTGRIKLIDRETGEPIVALTPALLTTEAFGGLASLNYKIAVTKKVPAPQQNLKDMVKVITGMAGSSLIALEATRGQSLCAGQNLRIEPLPSDMEVTALIGDKGDEALSKHTYDNERKYNIDFSFAVPLETYNELTLVSESGAVTAKKVEKTDLFAVVNLSLWPYDTKKAQAQILPVILYGMPITGNPLKHQLLAFGFGLNKAQVFVGWQWDRIEAVSAESADGVTTGTIGSPVAGKKWNSRVVWGLNLPVRTVVDLLAPKK